jgi:hypothetical protein
MGNKAVKIRKINVHAGLDPLLNDKILVVARDENLSPSKTIESLLGIITTLPVWEQRILQAAKEQDKKDRDRGKNNPETPARNVLKVYHDAQKSQRSAKSEVSVEKTPATKPTESAPVPRPAQQGTVNGGKKVYTLGRPGGDDWPESSDSDEVEEEPIEGEEESDGEPFNTLGAPPAEEPAPVKQPVFPIEALAPTSNDSAQPDVSAASKVVPIPPAADQGAPTLVEPPAKSIEDEPADLLLPGKTIPRGLLGRLSEEEDL